DRTVVLRAFQSPLAPHPLPPYRKARDQTLRRPCAVEPNSKHWIGYGPRRCPASILSESVVSRIPCLRSQAPGGSPTSSVMVRPGCLEFLPTASGPMKLICIPHDGAQSISALDLLLLSYDKMLRWQQVFFDNLR